MAKEKVTEKEEVLQSVAEETVAEVSETTGVSELPKEESPEEVTAADETEEVEAEEMDITEARAKKVLSPEEYDQFKMLRAKIHFGGHKVSKASKSELRKMYSGERIVTEDGDIAAETETTRLKEDMLELAASARSGRILEGRIIGCRDVDSSTNTKRVMAVVEYGNKTCQVLIPDFVLFHFEYTEVLDEKTQRNVKRRIEAMLGANIKFIVKHFDQKTRVAYADRLKAMESIAWGNYVRETRDGRPRVVPNMIAQATVIAVSQNFIIVNALGSDSKIMKGECAWGYVDDCRNKFGVNEKVNVKVLDVKPGKVTKSGKEVYNLVFTSLSIKQATADPIVKYFNDYVEGGRYVATVTGVTDSGVFVNIDDKVPALVAFPKYGELPTPGEQRVVQISGKEVKEEPKEDGTNKLTYRIFGVIAPK